MNTSVRARHGAGGFSFVELLVTIVIAGIVFAAMVPVFVSATQKGAGDRARNVSLNLAQDKIEKIRQLDYDLLTEANLNSTTFSDKGFGPTASVSGAGDTKSYNVTYTVTFVGGAFDGQNVVNYSSGNKLEAYKQVLVDVFWQGNPKPVRHAILKTLVYKQYAGVYTDFFFVTPTGYISGSNPADRLFITSYDIVLTAYVNEADALNTKNVTFTVFNSNGDQIAKLVQATSSPAGVFSVAYTIVGDPGSQDGTYTFKASAVSKRGYSGNTQVLTLPVETGAPPFPTGLAAVPSATTIDLAWDQSPTGDVVKYELYRHLEGSDFGADPSGWVNYYVDSVDFVVGKQPRFSDLGLTSGTKYYYAVRAVDQLGNKSVLSSEVFESPLVPADDVPPNPVTVASASTSGTQAPPLKVRVTWAGTTDAVSPTPKPTSGMKCYYIYRSDDGVTYAPTPTYTVDEQDPVYYNAVTGTYTLDDSSGLKPLKVYYYKIIAVDKALNLAASGASVSSTTLNYNYCSVTVFNSRNQAASLTVTNPDGSTIDVWPAVTNPSSPASVAKNAGLVWKLPVGFAFVAWNKGSGPNPASKPIPTTGVISSTTPMTVSLP